MLKHDSLDEQIDAIDDANQVIGQISRADSYQKKISHRIVHVMVVDGAKIFLVRRSMEARYLPGFYCTSAGGHVLSGETAPEAAAREMQEEIGLSGPLQLLTEFFFQHEFSVHVSLFIKKFDPARDSFDLSPREVMDGRFFTVDETSALNRSIFHPQLIPCLEKTIAHLKDSSL